MEIYGNKGETIEEKTHANTSCTIAVAVNKEINAAKVNHSRAASSIITHIKVLSLLEGVETELLLFRTPGASNLTVANNYPLFKSGVQVKGDFPWASDHKIDAKPGCMKHDAVLVSVNPESMRKLRSNGEAHSYSVDVRISIHPRTILTELGLLCFLFV